VNIGGCLLADESVIEIHDHEPSLSFVADVLAINGSATTVFSPAPLGGARAGKGSSPSSSLPFLRTFLMFRRLTLPGLAGKCLSWGRCRVFFDVDAAMASIQREWQRCCVRHG